MAYKHPLQGRVIEVADATWRYQAQGGQAPHGKNLDDTN
jgi:hypothetical protein